MTILEILGIPLPGDADLEPVGLAQLSTPTHDQGRIGGQVGNPGRHVIEGCSKDPWQAHQRGINLELGQCRPLGDHARTPGQLARIRANGLRQATNTRPPRF